MVKSIGVRAGVFGLRIMGPIDVGRQCRDDGSVNYGMGFDTERADDEHLIVNGIQLLVAPQSTPYLQGVTLDFVEMSPGDMRFIFIPPYPAEDGPAETDAAPAE